MSVDDQQLIEDFVIESCEHMADVEGDLLTIEAAGADIDVELVNKVFRAVHSVKGAAGFLGFTTLGELAHSLENVLNLIRGKELTPTANIVNVLLKAADALRVLLVNVRESNGTDISAHVKALQQVVSGETTPEVRESMERTIDLSKYAPCQFKITEQALKTLQGMNNRLFVIKFDLIADIQDQNKAPVQLVQELDAFGEVVDALVESADWGDLNSPPPEEIWFSVLFATVLEVDLVQQAFDLEDGRVFAVEIENPTQSAAATPVASAVAPPSPVKAPAKSVAPAVPATPAAAPSVAPAAKTAAASPVSSKPADTNIRVSVGLLDHLMNLAGELVLSRNQLMQAVNDGHQDKLQAVGSQLDRITSELQGSIMQTRLQQIGSTLSKFPRIVRDLSSQLGKQCELTIEGKDVDLDKSIIEAIGDPLTHLVRNSVDHGIESPEERRAKGKDPVGKIFLRAFHQAGKVNIVISDDGAGVDVARIKEKALSNGLLTPDQARDLGEREALQFLFHPGFSTAKIVSDVSGRGVGMDVVKTNIEKLGGTVEITTELGAGTMISIKLPLTLAIIPSLIVRSGEDRFAVSQVNINELVRVRATDVGRRIERVKDAEVLRLRGSLLPLVRLSTVLGHQSKYLDPLPNELEDNDRVNIADRRAGEECESEIEELRSGDDRREDTAAGALNILVVEAGHLKYGLIVDSLHDSEEIVVKPLGRHMKQCKCLAGATILGDGSVAMILDITGIALQARLTAPVDAEQAALDKAESEMRSETQSVVLFTNDPSEQFGIPMGLISRIERISRDQIDSVGQQEVLQYRGATLPLLNLEHHIKALPRPDQAKLYVVAFSVNNREVGLVAPELVDIRQIPTMIDDVTFREQGVLGSIIVENVTTRLIDLYELARKGRPEWFEGARVAETAEGGVPTILLAEDSGFFRSQLSSFLEGEGYEVVGCEDGLIAWNTLQDPERRFDLVITDIEMPNMDGLQFAKQIKNDPMFAHLPVIAVTSLASDEDIQRGRDVGIDEYQVKLDRDQLLAAVGRYMKAARLKAGGSAREASVQARS